MPPTAITLIVDTRTDMRLPPEMPSEDANPFFPKPAAPTMADDAEAPLPATYAAALTAMDSTTWVVAGGTIAGGGTPAVPATAAAAIAIAGVGTGRTAAAGAAAVEVLPKVEILSILPVGTGAKNSLLAHE